MVNDKWLARKQFQLTVDDSISVALPLSRSLHGLLLCDRLHMCLHVPICVCVCACCVQPASVPVPCSLLLSLHLTLPIQPLTHPPIPPSIHLVVGFLPCQRLLMAVMAPLAARLPDVRLRWHHASSEGADGKSSSAAPGDRVFSTFGGFETSQHLSVTPHLLRPGDCPFRSPTPSRLSASADR
ncbi:unnamed protein product [Protopolystoma xenopodis]|uniref:Uncharacterized protein n=1 Tax=Protopolystoma xenopodis TaxID=117903 RepID=A0A448XL67_9PLAT|nr:unnamed protein product [Protopolystoma xenopodis]